MIVCDSSLNSFLQRSVYGIECCTQLPSFSRINSCGQQERGLFGAVFLHTTTGSDESSDVHTIRNGTIEYWYVFGATSAILLLFQTVCDPAPSTP